MPESVATDDLVAKAREMCEGVTPGPWTHVAADNLIYGLSRTVVWTASSRHYTEGARDANAAFIAWARSAVPAMATAIESWKGHHDDLSRTANAALKEFGEMRERAYKAESALTAMTASRDAMAEETARMSGWFQAAAASLSAMTASRDALAARIEAADAKVQRLTKACDGADAEMDRADIDCIAAEKRAEAAEKALAAMRATAAALMFGGGELTNAETAEYWHKATEPAQRARWLQSADAMSKLFEVRDAE